MQSARFLIATAALTVAIPNVHAETVNVECRCQVSPLKTVSWFDYVISTSVPDKSKVSPDIIAYACYKQREQASNACMEGKDRDSSLKYFRGKLQAR